MGRMRNLLVKLLDRIDPPKRRPVAPCPRCGVDLWERNHTFRIDCDLTYVRCICGTATGWMVTDNGPPQLVLSDTPDQLDDE